MMTDDRATPQAWLEAGGRTSRLTSLLGCLLLAAAAAALVGAGDMQSGRRERWGPGFFPRSSVDCSWQRGSSCWSRRPFGTFPPARWRSGRLRSLLLRLRPPISPPRRWVATCCSGSGRPSIRAPPPHTCRCDRARASVAAPGCGHGSLRSVAGHLSAWTLRRGLRASPWVGSKLLDGISIPSCCSASSSWPTACCALPRLRCCWRPMRGELPVGPVLALRCIAAIAMRLVAVLAIAAAGYYAFELNRTIWDVGMLVAFGLFGAPCKVFGWNRLVLILGFAYGVLLEQTYPPIHAAVPGRPCHLFPTADQRHAAGCSPLAVASVAGALSMWRMVEASAARRRAFLRFRAGS